MKPENVTELVTVGSPLGLRNIIFDKLTPRPDAPNLRASGLAGRVALLLGSEGPGLTEAALTAADVHLRIPMAPGVDSLNVATAGAIAFAEIAVGR